ncbi:type II toxin-antitoxin system RelE/ParE family toxin [Paludisphaera rhizosphaerae]|uniref:type II toxin-antitoxin system RelE/ParE family toxin n=1 Tax=Paludisphaera rhizosphaerae TaxID=2711216 RepID=UPI0013EC91CB|nr:type II toxin-antitoxin system RelE/ParE family toxin [Paludisphaera rhizosphaerae]
MPRTEVVFFREDDESVPLLDWLTLLPPKALVKCLAKLARLEELGYELRRPEADLLRDGIYELRVRLGTVNYRMLYFFHGRAAAVVSHGLTKEKIVPPAEIDHAIERKTKFEADPEKHRFQPEPRG